MAARQQERTSSATRTEVEDAVRALEGAQAVLVVCVAALMRSNADIDRDVARALMRHASDPVDVAVELLTRTFGIERADSTEPSS